MENYLINLIYFFNTVIITIVLGVFFTKNIRMYKTSVFASFLFLTINRNFNQKNNLYNFIHNKTINI